MKIEPVRYSRLIMQLRTPTPMKAARQARSATPSSERRTPGAAAISKNLFEGIGYVLVLPMFVGIVHYSSVNPNPVFVAAASMGPWLILGPGQQEVSRQS